MLDFIKGLLSGQSGQVAQIVSILVLCNGVLGGVKLGLDAIKDKTASTVDNTIASVLGKGLGVLSWCIDFVQGNLAHKDDPKV